MEKADSIRILESAAILMPVQWGFKDRLGNGAHLELLLRRVKHGHETECEDVYGSGFSQHIKGRFSDAQTLLERLQDKALPAESAQWMRTAVDSLLRQMTVCARKMPALVQLFSPKGKIELYGPETPVFNPQYISGNFTLKIHASSLTSNNNLFAHLIAQHLDYPFAAGERRFSTSRLFDLCFATEKVIAPLGLASIIDTQLEKRGIYQPERQACSNYDHVKTLLEGDSAAIRTSYERVLQRERFAATIAAFYGTSQQTHKAPILQHYQQLVEVDLLAHQQREFANYPPKQADRVTEAMHVPLMMIFTTAGKHELVAHAN